jgi:hypothetical protein
LWANFKALVGISSQSFGPSLAIWVNPVNFTLKVGKRWAQRLAPTAVWRVLRAS